MALKAFRFEGLNADVLLPDDIEVIVDIAPDSLIGWVRSGDSFSGQTKTTFHNTGNSGSTAKAERDYLHGGPQERNPETGKLERRLVGFNFAVDDKRIIQITPLNEITWAAGTPVGNKTSWHVEQCFGGNIDFDRSLRNTIMLHAGLIAAKGWDSDTALVRHNHWRKKHCPAKILDMGLWPSVQRRVGEAARAAGGSGPIGGGATTFVEPSPVPELAPFRDQDANTVPAVVLASDGSPFYFVGDRAKAIRETPRLQLANPDSDRVGPDLKVGEEFDVLWIFTSTADNQSYYITPFDTRVKVADTARLGDKGAPAPEPGPGEEPVIEPDGPSIAGGDGENVRVEDEDALPAPGH